MSEEECSNEVLQLSILARERTNVLGSFRGHRLDFSLNCLQELPISYVFGGPYVAITYRLGIIQEATQEVLSCSLTPTSNGFSVNNGESIIAVNISPQGIIITSAHTNSILGIVTLLLPSSGPQIFEITIQLYSTGTGGNMCYIHKKISVPGPRLNEYQEGPGIEKPIRKLRPKGMWSNLEGTIILRRFQRLADDGDRERFTQTKERFETLIDNYPRFIDLMPLLLFEETLLDLHENRLEDGKRHAKQALEISQRYSSPNHCYLLSKLKYVESALARREGNYEKAKELLDDSVELLLPCAAGEETAENRYFYAAFFAEKSAKVGITDHEQAMAENLFQDVERHLGAETRPITARTQIRAKNRQIAFYVKSSRHVKHLDFLKEVSDEQMTKAGQLIEEIEKNLIIHYPSKPLLTFDIVKTDYFIRRGNYEQGIKPSTEALRIATEKHWREYEDVASERIQLCRQQLTTRPTLGIPRRQWRQQRETMV